MDSDSITDLKTLTAAVKAGAARSLTSEEMEKRLLKSILRVSRWVVCRVIDPAYPAAEIVWVSPPAEATFGYVHGELLGKDLSVLIPERLREAHASHLLGYLADPIVKTMGAREMQLFGRRKNGTEFPVAVALSPEYIASTLHVFASIIPSREFD